MERERFTLALNAVRPSRWKSAGTTTTGRRRFALPDVSIRPFLWLAVLYLCALYAFHAMAR